MSLQNEDKVDFTIRYFSFVAMKLKNIDLLLYKKEEIFIFPCRSYLRDNSKQKLPVTQDTLNIAITKGHLRIVKYLIGIKAPYKDHFVKDCLYKNVKEYMKSLPLLKPPPKFNQDDRIKYYSLYCPFLVKECNNCNCIRLIDSNLQCSTCTRSNSYNRNIANIIPNLEFNISQLPEEI